MISKQSGIYPIELVATLQIQMNIQFQSQALLPFQP